MFGIGLPELVVILVVFLIFVGPARLPDIARTFAQEHHDLIPYTRSLVYASTQTGMPAMRMMPFAFPDDPAVFCFGESVIVAVPRS